MRWLAAIALLLPLPASAVETRATCGPGAPCRAEATVSLTCTIISTEDLTWQERPTGIEGVAIFDVTTSGQGISPRSQSVLYVAGSLPATVVWSDNGPLWRLPPDALAYELRDGDERRALAYVARALKTRTPRATLAAILSKARPAKPVLLAEAP